MSNRKQRIFFSYAREDTEFALRLATDLKDHGVNIWFDQLDIHPGDRWDRSIEKALETSSSFLVILSPNAVDSANVMDEVSYALEEEKKIIPILYRECKIPFRLRRLQHINFVSNYDQGSTQLVTALAKIAVVIPTVRKTETHQLEQEASPKAKSQPQDSTVKSAHEVAQITLTPKHETHPPRDPTAGALIGSLIGAIYGSLSAFFIYLGDQRMNTLERLLEPIAAYAIIAAVAGAIAGTIVGKSPKVLIPIGLGVLVTDLVWIAIWGTYADVIITGMVMGGGMTALVIAGIWAVLRRMRERSG